MKARKRRPIPLIKEDERFFQRFNYGDIEVAGPKLSMIKAPDQSINRSVSGGKWWFSIMPEPNESDEAYREKKLKMGVLAFPASAVEMIIADQSNPNAVPFETRIVHEVLEHNYHHCEIGWFRGGERISATQADDLRGEDKAQLKRAKIYYRAKFRDAYIARTIQTICEAEAKDAPAIVHETFFRCYRNIFEQKLIRDTSNV